jgi:hypothetical protein
VSIDVGHSGTYHHVLHPEQLITKMEDAANICSTATTLLCKKLWVWFWTISESWLARHWPSRYCHLHCVGWWYICGFHISACGMAVCWLTKEKQAAICNLPSHSAIHCFCLDVHFHPHHSHYSGTLRLCFHHWQWSHCDLETEYHRCTDLKRCVGQIIPILESAIQLEMTPFY